MPQRLSRRRLLGLDRSGPEPTQTRAGQPLRPFTIPNLICYVRLAAIPVFCAIAFDSGDGRDALASLIFLAIALGDLLDGFVARATGQYSRLGALLDPVVDRLTILAGAAVCWHFELLPRWAIALLALREVTTLALSYYGLKHGADIEITWVGRIAVFLIMGGIFWSMVLDWTIIRIGFSVGVILSIVATVLYVREARRHVQTSVQPSRSD
ncbi:MAG: CDP-alcohol phosphatidyltransferase family protein [Solirubrobacterales bacterium]|nr:CDP-alcohol phosphatidyltransferase family protein [Solirubrobacterales bacterium]MCB8970166.1 CDP-alcohol phosphatidyltransferase family protein [Thermoleophilales bacterium]MCO5326738.1 CDP-alcohol phosphatidyltransferase family protein [Solirubrobacterales bacterium]